MVEQVRIVLDMVLQQGYFIDVPIDLSIESYLGLDWALQHGYLSEPFDNLYVYAIMDSYLVFNWALQHDYFSEPFDNLYVYATMDSYLVFNWALQHGYFIESFNTLTIYPFN